MKSLSVVLYLGLLSLLFSCSSESTSTTKGSKKSSPNAMEQEYDLLIAAIENNPDLTVMKSLAFNNNAGSTIQAIVFFDQFGNEVKMEEKYSDIETGNYGTSTFYFKEGRLFASKEIYHDELRKKPTFVERVSYYDSIPKVKLSKERTTFYEEDLPNTQFKAIQPVACSFDRAMRALNEEGEFITTFQGFITNGDMEYILVGENSENGFVSSLSITYKDPLLEKLKSNERKYLGTLLEVEFQEAEDVSGMNYQLLTSIKLRKK